MANVLIVDDAMFMRKMLADILSKKGHQIVGEGANAKEAIELYKTLQPDLMTLDLIMPEVDNIDTRQAIESIKQFDEHAKIIIVSAMGQQGIIKELFEAGANDFIIKPFQDTQVIEAVEKLIGT